MAFIVLIDFGVHLLSDGSGNYRAGMGLSTSTTFSESMTFLETGKVGVGSTNPSTNFHVRASGSSGKTYSNTAGMIVENDGTSNLYYVLQVSTTGAPDAFSITNAGNIGIGVASPSSKLEVSGSSGSTIKIIDGNQGAGKVLTSDANGQASWQSASGGFAGAVEINSTPYSITTSDSGKAFYYTNNASGVVNLPALSGVSNGFSVTITRDVAKNLTITPAGSDKFPGGVTTIEMQGQNIQSMTIMKLGSTWKVVNKTDECIIGQDCWTANVTGGMKQLYVGNYNGHQYFTTPGGCGYEPSGNSTTTPPTANFTPTCSGTDTVQKAWATTAPESTTLLNLTNATDGQAQSSTLATYATANAAKYCENLDYAGYQDWYLPARQELALLYQNSGPLGGFLYPNSSYYWSSTESTSGNAWYFTFANGYPNSSSGKSTAYYVRWVRRF